MSPSLFKLLSQLYPVLAAHIRPDYRTGPGLSSEEEFCSLFLIILSDAKDLARIKVAGGGGGEIWFGFYREHEEEPAVEFIQKKSRGEYGTQVARWALRGASQLIGAPPGELRMLFSGYTP